jgi:hypothetical protein
MSALPLRVILGPIQKIELNEPKFNLADFIARIPPEILEQIERLNLKRRIVNNQVIEFDESMIRPVNGLEERRWPELRLDGGLAIRDGALRFLLLWNSLQKKKLPDREVWEKLLTAAQRGLVSWPSL